MTDRIRIISNENIMVHWPSGKVEFVTFWGFIKLAWWAIHNKVQITIEGKSHD